MYRANIVQDISTLTTVQKSSIDRLCTQAVKCICYCVCEAMSKDEKDMCLDIGVGNLFINIDNESVRYRFEPSVFMDNSVSESVLSGKNPVIEDIESSLLNKVNTTYKELF
jgi:hypothetical protein